MEQGIVSTLLVPCWKLRGPCLGEERPEGAVGCVERLLECEGGGVDEEFHCHVSTRLAVPRQLHHRLTCTRTGNVMHSLMLFIRVEIRSA